MADAERIDEALERNLPARCDRVEQVPHRDGAEPFPLLQADLGVAALQREDVGGLLDEPLLEEQRDLLFPEPFDVEGATRHDVAQVLDLLVRAGELAAAAGDRALLP